MSTNYYAACDQCRQIMPMWSRSIGGCGPLSPLRDDPDSFQMFLFDHLHHGLAIIDEHDNRADDYACPWLEGRE